MLPRRLLVRLGVAGLLGVSAAALQQALRWGAPSAPAAEASPTDAAAPRTSQPTVTPTAEIVQAISSPTAAARPTVLAALYRPTPEAIEALGEDTPAIVRIPAPRPPIIARADWGAAPPADNFVPQRPRQITLHHEGVYFDGSRSALDYLRHVQRWSVTHRRWPDIPYHFLIDLAGRIYEGRPLDARGDTNTSYDLRDHALVALIGKYDQGEQEPSRPQIESIIALMGWISATYTIAPNLIFGHRDFIPLNDKGEHIDPRSGEKITCPGDNLYRYLADGTIQQGVAAVLARTHAIRRAARMR
jgi:hypothetical protein